MLRFFFTAFAIMLLNTAVVWAEVPSTQIVNDSTTSNPFKEEVIKTLEGMQVSMEGRTSQGNTYNLYAIRMGKEWTYIILDSTGYYSLKQIKGQEDVQENAQTYTEMVCMMAKAQMLKKISKPKIVSGLTLSCYYKFRPRARTMYKQFNYMEKKAKFINQNLKNGGKGIMKLLQTKF